MNNINNLNGDETELIDEILKIDEIAKEKLAQEKQIENESLKNLETAKKQIIASLNEQSKKALNKFSNFKNNEFENELKKLDQKKEQIILNLKHTYEKNESQWIKQTISKALEQHDSNQ